VIQPTVSRDRWLFTCRRGVLFVVESTTVSGAQDPYRSFNFAVEIDAIMVAGFSEVSGLTAETEVIEYRTGGMLAHEGLELVAA